MDLFVDDEASTKAERGYMMWLVITHALNRGDSTVVKEVVKRDPLEVYTWLILTRRMQ